MEEPIEESYFNWLCAKVLSNNQNYLELMRILHSTEFTWVVSRDENRAEDGIELREYFLRETGLHPDIDWFNQPCSVLEMFIAFSNRAYFQLDDISPKDWFWEFMTNLKLDEFRRVSESDEREIHHILKTFLSREYEDDGQGGMFPMRRPEQDQREVEIWYQFCEYVEDHGLLYGRI